MMTSVQTISDAREALHQQASQLNLLAFWTVRSYIELGEPRSTVLPYLWRWTDVLPLLLQSGALVTVEEAERRALLFINPSLGGKPYMTKTFYGGVSLIRPGESAPVHRHAPSASRFGLRGSGGFTTVEGEKCRISPGDLIITPNWTWHDHGNDGSEEMIWLDILDVPLVEHLDATFFDFDYAETDAREERVRRTAQSIAKPLDYSSNLYSTGGVSPKFVS